ncbi:MAG: ABC transporter transmembrane domain-containing protein [Pseudomonadota bacterium]
MSKTILSFIWTYSARQQIILLVLTIISFPILYISLELPKQIINEAIGSSTFPITYFGVSLDQLEYMAVLCGLFLLTVIVSGLVKMRKNIYQGTVSERLLRRFRYQLIARILRFPLPHFRRTSQGALISMVTAETEPMGAMMGQAVSRPVFAAGQMLTVSAFLFVQSVWLGLAAVLMIPLQAYIIPKLQRQINLLNKERILVIRSLSDRINESVSGVEELRNNNGLSHALADFSRRLGNIFSIRLKIYNKKFFMKFLNNFMNQLTPFFFLSIGGYLVIEGQLTVGALAAALAAHKELMTPWRDLLAFYSQIQDVSIRYVTITEQFTQSDMIDEELFYGTPTSSPELKGDIHLDKVTVLDQFDIPVLDHISLDIKQGSMVAIQSDNSFVRRALAEAMTRSVVLASGRITVAGEDLSKLHQQSIARKIATAGGGTHVFSGTILDNLRMPLMPTPRELDSLSDETLAEMEESRQVGNSDDPLDTDWLNPELAGAGSVGELRDWWLAITRAIGLDEVLLNRGLETRVNPNDFPQLTDKILKLRRNLWDHVRTEEFAKYVHFFDDQEFNPGLTVGENLLFAVRNPDGSDRNLVGHAEFRATLERLGLLEEMRGFSFHQNQVD